MSTFITLAAANERRALRDQFLTLLCAEAKRRPERRGVTKLPDGYTELEWITLERQAMHAEVNRLRSDRQLPPVDVAAFERVEAMASGHCDYAEKFSLYCAELAMGLEVRP